MGKGRDKRKKAKGGSQGQGAVKTAKKTELNEEKSVRRAERKAAGGEDDLDALLARFALEDKQKSTVQTLENQPPPSARVFASFTPFTVQKDTGIIMYGGEYTDTKTDRMYVKSGLYRFHTAQNKWTRIVIPNGPPPRSAHQAVVHKIFMYVFGGELTSVNQEKFRHYKDLWRLDLINYAWEQLPAKKGPCARSGHRMVAHKNRLLLFGGFTDDDKKQAYYNDLWAFDTVTLQWAELTTSKPAPSPRGGCQLALHNDSLFVVGGHSWIREPGGDEVDKVHDDIWVIDLNANEWSKVKRAGMAPQPRSSFSMVTHKNRAILFGGVTDQAGKGDRLFSENHDELYQLNLESRRWFPVSMRAPAKGKAAAQAREESSAASSEGATPPATDAMEGLVSSGAVDKSSPLYQAALRIQSRYRGYVVRKAYTTYKLGGKMSELLYSPATYGVDFSSKSMLKPRARQSPMMAVCKNTLWLMGGIVEVSHTDVTLDDLWCLDLAKLDGWKCVKENTEGEEAFREEEDWETDDGSQEDESD